MKGIPRVVIWATASAVFGLLPARAPARTWEILKDPAIPADQIGQVVSLAESGDSILIGPGTYVEHIPVGDKTLYIASLQGAGSTILDGRVPIDGRNGSIIYTDTDTRVDLTLVALTLTGGTGSPDGPRGSAGGALAIWSWNQSHVHLADCVIRDNDLPADPPWDPQRGGGVFLVNVADALIERCVFSSNRADHGPGGHIYLSNCHCRVVDSRFSLGEEEAQCIVAENNVIGSVWVEDSRFESVQNVTGGVCINADGGEIVLLRNQFIDATAHYARTMRVNESLIDVPLALRIEGNLFAGPGPPLDNPDILVNAWECDFELIGNTLVETQLSFGTTEGAPVRCSNNIFCRSLVRLTNHRGGGQVSCNDAWPDTIFVRSGNMAMEDNIAADPMFCSEGSGDFTIAQESPCAPGNSPDQCGLIGALPVSCSNTPTQRTTWGRIRASFR